VLRGSRVIVIGGIKRSGSTWQYNLVRLILEATGRSVGLNRGIRYLGKYEGDYDDLIVKTHFHSDRAEAAADVVFTSYRPLDQVRASLERFGRKPPSSEEIEKLVHHFRLWDRIADYRMEYADLLSDPLKVTMETMEVLHAGSLDPVQVLAEVNSLKPPSDEHQDPLTLYFSNHVTSE